MIANDHHNPIELITQLQAKLKEKIQYEDLAGEEDTAGSTGGPALRLTKMDRYLHGPTPVSAMQYKTSDDVLRAHQRVMHDMLAWKPDLSQVGHGLFRRSLNGTGTSKNGLLFIMPNILHCNLCGNLNETGN